MTIEYARYLVEPSRAEAFCEAWSQASAGLRADPECLSYEVAESSDQPGGFLVRIAWASENAAPFAQIGPGRDDLVAVDRYEVRTTSPTLPEKGLPTLYAWAGEAAAITRLIDAF